jgi:hypothetical protein
MSFLKEVFGPKSLIEDVRATIIGMMTGGAVLFFGSIGGAIWKSVREQPIPWTILILIGVAGISLLLAATIKLLKADKPEQPLPLTQDTPIAPSIVDALPTQDDLSWLDTTRMFEGSWRELLIANGQSLMERWTTPLGYPEKQRRENESVNWISDANAFARKHLKGEQLDQFTKNYRTAISPEKKYDLLWRLRMLGHSQELRNST